MPVVCFDLRLFLYESYDDISTVALQCLLTRDICLLQPPPQQPTLISLKLGVGSPECLAWGFRLKGWESDPMN